MYVGTTSSILMKESQFKLKQPNKNNQKILKIKAQWKFKILLLSAENTTAKSN